MKSRLGIIGCGQLSQMLAEAANRLGVTVSFLCLDETPVVQGLGRIYEASELDQFLDSCDAITVERESIPDDILQRATREVGLAPGYEALVTLRERDTQKAMLDRLDIPTSPWRRVGSPADLAAAYAELGCTYIRCKRILGGYDGGGQWRVGSSESMAAIPEGGYPLIAEAEIAIERELAIIIARDVNGDSVCYPMTENAMRDGILIGSFVPAGVGDALSAQAADYARTLVDAMSYVGVLAIEFFITDGQLIVNEIAPRVHNTGHWSIGAIGDDQFTQHVRTVLGEPVRQPRFSESAAMVNILDAGLPAELPAGPVRMLLQTYGKGVRKGRKLGHLTLIGPDATEVRGIAQGMIAELHGDD